MNICPVQATDERKTHSAKCFILPDPMTVHLIMLQIMNDKFWIGLDREKRYHLDMNCGQGAA